MGGRRCAGALVTSLFLYLSPFLFPSAFALEAEPVSWPLEPDEQQGPVSLPESAASPEEEQPSVRAQAAVYIQADVPLAAQAWPAELRTAARLVSRLALLMVLPEAQPVWLKEPRTAARPVSRLA